MKIESMQQSSAAHIPHAKWCPRHPETSVGLTVLFSDDSVESVGLSMIGYEAD